MITEHSDKSSKPFISSFFIGFSSHLLWPPISLIPSVEVDTVSLLCIPFLQDVLILTYSETPLLRKNFAQSRSSLPRLSGSSLGESIFMISMTMQDATDQIARHRSILLSPGQATDEVIAVHSFRFN
jgi:hypothetical protein